MNLSSPRSGLNLLGVSRCDSCVRMSLPLKCRLSFPEREKDFVPIPRDWIPNLPGMSRCGFTKYCKPTYINGPQIVKKLMCKRLLVYSGATAVSMTARG